MSDDDGIEDLLDQNQYNFLDLIGRFGQLKAQNNTKKEIRELKNLLAQQQKKEAALPKCPWCAGAIVENVFKCRHCSSDIEWVSINGLVPCRPQDKEEVEKKETALQKQLVEKARLEKEQQRVKEPNEMDQLLEPYKAVIDKRKRREAEAEKEQLQKLILSGEAVECPCCKDIVPLSDYDAKTQYCKTCSDANMGFY
jgi:hypothetical protein